MVVRTQLVALAGIMHHLHPSGHTAPKREHLQHGGRLGGGMITQPQQGSSGFRTATPEEAEESASFKQHPC